MCFRAHAEKSHSRDVRFCANSPFPAMLSAMTDLDRRSADTTGQTVRALAAQRHEVITAQLRLHGAVRVGDLAALLDVSEMTVRRDLDALSELGVLAKVHAHQSASPQARPRTTWRCRCSTWSTSRW